MTIRTGLLCGVLALGLATQPAWAEGEGKVLRISLDTAPAHERNVALADYTKQLEAATGGRIRGEIFASGQLYPDRDVTKALIQGGVDMAAPGTWMLGGLVPDADIVEAPMFFGRSMDEVHRVTDGPVGAAAIAEIEGKLRVKVLGPFLDLGFIDLYSARHPLRRFSDLVGLKVRNPGGAGNAARTILFGGIPNATPWTDVPMALAEGNFDALMSTDETLVSGKMWESGINSGFVDHEYPALYVPMVSGAFWRSLSPSDQSLMVELWARNIAAYRARAAESQAAAHATLIAHGVAFTTPSGPDLAEARRRLMTIEDRVAEDLKLSPALVAKAAAALDGGGG
jgi:C4-dicarboxylate-binding protein DctP